MVISILPEFEAPLKARAEAAGIPIEEFVHSLIRREIQPAETPGPDLSTEPDGEFEEIRESVI